MVRYFFYLMVIVSITGCQQWVEDLDCRPEALEENEAKLLRQIKSEVSIALEKENAIAQKTNLVVNPRNVNNAYDSAGIIHNQALDYLIPFLPSILSTACETLCVDIDGDGNCDPQPCSTRQEKITGYLYEFSKNRGTPSCIKFPDAVAITNIPSTLGYTAANEYDIPALQTLLTNFINLQYTQGKISLLEREILDLYQRTVSDLNTVNQYIIASKVFEDIIANSFIGPVRKARILSAISIGKYSGYYWETQINLGSASGYAPFDIPIDVTGRKKWWAIALADIAGGIAGGLVGCAGGPIGIGVGAGLAGSGASAEAKQIIDRID